MKHRIFYDQGKLTVYPPTLKAMKPLMQKLGQPLEIESIKPSSFFVPSLHKTRKLLVGITQNEANHISIERLWQIHDSKQYYNHGMTLLDLKIEICRRLYEKCMLCGHRCGVNRFQQKGKCGVGTESYYDYWGELIGEEDVINPSAGIALYGCTWNCAFCHAPDYLNINNSIKEGKLLCPDLWKEIDYNNCQAIEFNAAGDPTPHLLSILELLNIIPANIKQSFVWSSNSYATRDVWKLLDGLFDVYLVDLKWGNDDCAEKLGGCKNNNKVAEDTLESLSWTSGRKIIRWLLLPSHVDCCGKEIVKMISKHGFYISLLDDFIDDYKMLFKRKNTEAEIQKAKELIKQYGLKDINNPEVVKLFWKA